MIKEYEKEDKAVVWKPDLCTCSGICYMGLPEVFQPNERPWVITKNASKEKIIAQVNLCPSGALSIKEL